MKGSLLVGWSIACADNACVLGSRCVCDEQKIFSLIGKLLKLPSHEENLYHLQF